MANKTCEKCGHLFATPSQLQIHLKRKTPCDTQNKKFKCKYCNVLFSSSTSMHRHIRKTCTIFRLEEQKKIQEEQKKIEDKKKEPQNVLPLEKKYCLFLKKY